MGAGQETTLHEVAAILRTLRDPCTFPVCSSVTIGEYPMYELSVTSLLHNFT